MSILQGKTVLITAAGKDFIVYSLSPQSQYITGQAILVDGGVTI